MADASHRLTMRATDIAHSPGLSDLEDWTVLDDGRPVGRIYERRAPASATQTWHWSITEYVEPRAGLRTSGTSSTLNEAKAAFKASWLRWRAWAARTGFDPA
jgi:hypothetical protein